MSEVEMKKVSKKERQEVRHTRTSLISTMYYSTTPAFKLNN